MKSIIILLCLFLLNCNDDNTPQPTEYDTDNIVNIGHGVYYFTSTGKKFCIQLAKFKTNHEIISIAEDGRSGYGATLGYIVVCKENFSDTYLQNK
jgi:hypothetical protein